MFKAVAVQHGIGVGPEGFLQKITHLPDGRKTFSGQHQNIVGIVKIIIYNVTVVGDQLFGEIDGLHHPHSQRALALLIDVQQDIAVLKLRQIVAVGKPAVRENIPEAFPVAGVGRWGENADVAEEPAFLQDTLQRRNVGSSALVCPQKKELILLNGSV